MARVAAVLLLVFGLLPLANWIPGGHAAPWYGERMALWTSGAAILAGVLVVSAIVFRRRPELWREGLWGGVAARWQAAGWKADVGIALVACIVYAGVSVLVFSARPLHIDEIIQVWQARVFASGRLWVPTPDQPEFTAALNLVDHGGRRFGQFPAGGPAMLMLGTLVGAEWLVGPVCAALAVLLFGRIVRRIESRPGTALAALLLFAFAPFWLFFAGSMMNHVTATAWLVAAAAALAVLVGDTRGRWPLALACGLALGIAATIRPMDAAAFALPTAAWLLWRARGGRDHVVALLASGVGVAIPIAALLYVNAQQTGNPLLFAYEVLWGSDVGIGFHAAPWGGPHTPWRGLELVNLYLLRLQTYFLETPAPALLFAGVSLLLVRRLNAFDRWVLASGGLLLVSYWAYWHDGFYLGPRFLLPLAPWLALWTVRLPAVLAERGVAPWVRQGVVTAGVVAVVMGGTMLLPIRAGQYANGMLSLRLEPWRTVADSGVTGALIFVRESWGAKLITRLWAADVDRAAAEDIYRRSDACVLEELLTQAERESWSADQVEGAATSRGRDRSTLVPIAIAFDTTLRAAPESRFTARCLNRLRDDSAGSTIFVTSLIAQDGNRYVRDLDEANRLVLDEEPGRDVWLLWQDPVDGGLIRLRPLRRDSLDAAWRQ